MPVLGWLGTGIVLAEPSQFAQSSLGSRVALETSTKVAAFDAIALSDTSILQVSQNTGDAAVEIAGMFALTTPGCYTRDMVHDAISLT